MDELDDVVAELWRAMQPVALARAQRLRAWADSGAPADDGVLDDAHKLAGALGMYGLAAAGDAAKQLEVFAREGVTGPEVRAAAAALTSAVEAAG